jgi:hypothetical protein
MLTLLRAYAIYCTVTALLILGPVAAFEIGAAVWLVVEIGAAIWCVVWRR